MKARTFVSISSLAMALSACGGSGPASSESPSAVAMGGAQGRVFDPTKVPELDAPLRIDQIPDLGKTASPRQGGRVRQGDAGVGLSIDTLDREAVRMFYNGLYAGPKEPAMNWTGSYQTGDAGTTSAEYQAFTLQRLNWFRAMAGVPANLQLSQDLNAKDQATAMLMSVNGQLSHFPPTTWKLYSAAAAEGASHSNLAMFEGAKSITSYIQDFGPANGMVGHRRWMFYPQTKTVGTGSVPGGFSNGVTFSPANAFWVTDDNYYGPRPSVRDDFVAWPSRGYVPYQVVFGRWSLSYPGADFSNASVVVVKDGITVPITKEPFAPGIGENTLVWLLAGTDDFSIATAPSKDQRYSVSITGVIVDGKPRTFNYDVLVFDPASPTPGAATSNVTLPAVVDAGSNFPIQVVPLKSSTGFSVAQYQRQNLLTNTFNTANAAGNWIIQTSGSYDSKAGSSFNLHHATATDQILSFNRLLIARGQPSITFNRSTGYATPQEVLKLQVTTDDGVTWVDAYSEFGSTTPTDSKSVQVDLAKFAGKPLKFRFVVSVLPAGLMYTCDTCGWNVADITLSNVEELINPQSFNLAAGVASKDLQIATPGDYVFFGRTQLQNLYYSDWGPAVYTHANGSTLTGPRRNYSIVKTDNGYTVTDTVGGDGVRTVVNPKRLNFTDLSIAYDTEGSAGATYRLYQAAFNRKPDLAGLGYWLKALDAGYPARDMAAGFVASAEFKALYGSNPTKEQIITAMYKNVLHRTPDTGGFAFWLNVMNNGVSVEAVLVSFADSPENRTQVAPDIVDGIQYIPYK